MKIHIITTTFGDLSEAEKIRDLLLGDYLSSCIQIQKIQSSYIWQDKIYNETEYKMSIKTTKKNLKKLKNRILSTHSYEIPEILIYKAKSTKKYLKWHKSSIK
ncbi:divalent cation tolerance protein CutA [Helicobacter sp. 16-1353]|uniref:divalent cation tolerance protein CutA n=1 Tax=Helicobacter sp. 16-1353 TaxID=2004996 RepID=UPI0011BDE966|nr:divalent cation tolerance protein CutA [Helicobacter sp. 16-1353]